MTNVSCTVDHGGMPCPWDKPMPGVPEINALLAEVEEALVAARYRHAPMHSPLTDNGLAALTDAVVLVTDREGWTINAPPPNYHWVARGRFAAAVLAALDGWTLVRVEDTRSLDIIRGQAATIATLRAALGENR